MIMSNFLIAIFPIKIFLSGVNCQTMRTWFYFVLFRKLIELECFRVGTVKVT